MRAARGVRSGRLSAVMVACLSAFCYADQPGGVSVHDAWIRWLPAGLPGAGYMTLTNASSEDYVMIGADSSDYDDVSFHQSREVGGMSEMAPIAAIDLKPHTTFRFAAGGYHLMLMRPKRPLQPGDTVQVVLHLQGGKNLKVPFTVRRGS